MSGHVRVHVCVCARQPASNVCCPKLLLLLLPLLLLLLPLLLSAVARFSPREIYRPPNRRSKARQRASPRFLCFAFFLFFVSPELIIGYDSK